LIFRLWSIGKRYDVICDWAYQKKFLNNQSYCNNILENQVCAYCGKEFSGREGWPHVEGDSNRGVLKIEHFCSEKHKDNFLNSSNL